MRCLHLAVLAFAISLPTSAQEGGIEVFAAGTLFASGTRTSVTHVYRRHDSLLSGTDEVSDPNNQRKIESRTVASIDHGIHRDVTLSLLVPYVEKEFKMRGTRTMKSSGIGDVALLGKWRAYKKDWRGGSFQIAIIGGIELPTGTTSETQGGSRLAASQQPGSGSYDPFVAFSVTSSHKRYRFDVLALTKYNSRGTQDFEAGDFLVLETGVGYRFLQAKYPGPAASARVGIQWRHESQAELSGTPLLNSGSNALIGRVGLGWHPVPRVDLSISMDFPLYEDVNGQQLGLDVRTFIGLGIRF